MDAGTGRDLERTEKRAIAELARAAPPHLAAREGIAVFERGGVTANAVRAWPGARMFNHALGVASARDLDDVEAFYREIGCAFIVSLARGADIDGELLRRGYTPDYGWMKFSRGLEAVEARTDLRVERVGQEHAASFGRIVAGAFELQEWAADWAAAIVGRPDWACFVSFDGDDPAGAGAVLLDGDAGWLGMGATLPAFRGRGSQSAIFAARVEAARDAGCSFLVTETGELLEDRPSASYRNILRAGFREEYVRPNWAAPPA